MRRIWYQLKKSLFAFFRRMLPTYVETFSLQIDFPSKRKHNDYQTSYITIFYLFLGYLLFKIPIS